MGGGRHHRDGAPRAGAAGFLLTNTEARELLEAVRTVAHGEGIVAPAVTGRLIPEFAAGPVRETVRGAGSAASG